MIAGKLGEEVYKCIKCGLCLTPCPVYNLLRFEGASPRGRIQLIKKILEGRAESSGKFRDLLSICLLCETCTANCPSGLRTDRLLKAMRAEVQERMGADWRGRLAGSLPRAPGHFPFFLSCGFTRERLVASGEDFSVPPRAGDPGGKPLREQVPEVNPVANPRGRVFYFTGCATNGFFSGVGRAVIQVLNRAGLEVIVPKEQVCCGLPLYPWGGRKTILKNIRENLKLLSPKEVETVVVDCASCGAALKKEYVHILEEEGEDAEPARELAGKVADISEILAPFNPGKILHPLSRRVTYHDPCHLGRSQGVKEQPRNLLRGIPGVELVEMAGAEICCGGGGSLPWEHPAVASGIGGHKAQAIRETRASVVASGCPWCRQQIARSLGEDSIRVVHPVELVAEALQEG